MRRRNRAAELTHSQVSDLCRSVLLDPPTSAHPAHLLAKYIQARAKHHRWEKARNRPRDLREIQANDDSKL